MRVVRISGKGAARDGIAMIGLDAAKSVFQVHALDEAGKGGHQAQAAKE